MPLFRNITIAILVLLISACDSWGSVDEAQALFEDNADEFFAMKDVIIEHPALKKMLVRADFDYNAKNGYVSFNDDDWEAYKLLLDKSKELNLISVEVVRNDKDNILKLVSIHFTVFGRGIAGDTEDIKIEYWVDPYSSKRFLINKANCIALSFDRWFVCS